MRGLFDERTMPVSRAACGARPTEGRRWPEANGLYKTSQTGSSASLVHPGVLGPGCCLLCRNES